jgi:hypothetical protein
VQADGAGRSNKNKDGAGCSRSSENGERVWWQSKNVPPRCGGDLLKVPWSCIATVTSQTNTRAGDNRGNKHENIELHRQLRTYEQHKRDYLERLLDAIAKEEGEEYHEQGRRQWIDYKSGTTR